MKGFIKWMDSASLLIKIILAIPVLDIVWVVYRLCKSLVKKNTLGIILAVVLIIVGLPFLWIIDIITILLTGKVIWIN